MSNYAEIIPIYEQRWAERPDSYYFIPLANAYRAAGQPHQAIGVLQQGLERHPDSLSGRAALAAAYLEAGLHTGAEEEAQRIL
ncbi:MAG: tetratricopeptide repeat protein, partial [Candidatus Tectimicrobiota bacterium]